jgi:mucin-19
MALVVADRVQETSVTSGTGTLTLAGALAGYQTFSTAIGNGNTTFYTIYDANLYDWEVGIGTVGAGTLARTTVLSNSAGTTSPISFASNSKFVFCTYPAEKSINYDADGVATIGQTLGYADTGIVGSFASTVAGYNQVIVQNKSTATNASSNLNVSNDAGTAGSNYAELGINSSTFTGTGSFNIAGASYVASASTDLTLGTYGAYNIHFVTNSNTTDAMTIYNNGGISLGTFGNPGIGNIAASKFVPGYTTVTSAASTTVLTADSNYYQNLVGSTTQTYQLPDATLLLVGTTFIFDNDSSGTLTVVDNASGPIETIPGGAASFVYLANNSTVAGTWRRHAFLPASYDFNATTANFGTATITNASWNGNTIGTAYGGTGLTTFGSANYALYSTSSSALVAGTLPVAAGGSGATTFTANGIVYGSGTSALGVTAAGTTGQVLLANTSGAPTWGSVPSTGAVTSFQTSLNGLTPSTATTGAVTLAGTLGATSGGTGLTTYTTGDIVYASATNTLNKLADVATGNALISGGVGVAPSYGKIGLTTHVSGTLPIANGGTNLTTYTTGDIVYASATNTLNKLADVATGNALISGGVGVAPSYGKIGLTTHVSGTLPIANGGTNQTSYTDGQLLIGNTTGNTLAKATLTAGTAISVTNGAGSITIANSAPSIIWQSVQTSGFTAVAGNGYPCNTTSVAFTVTLPASPTAGNQIQIIDYAGTFATRNITLARNGSNITGVASNYVLSTDREAVILTYIDATQGWIVSSAAYTTTPLSPVTYTTTYLIIAGGGGGGSNWGGGGGAGGYLTGTFATSLGTSYTAVVGAGGAGGVGSSVAGTSGSNSTFTGVTTAVGGGGGGDANTAKNGKTGGSGGGACGGNTNPATGGTATSGQGFAGGNNTSASSSQGGGGGGSSSAGLTGSPTAGSGGGGSSTNNSITGTSVAYAGGGGGGGVNGGISPGGGGGAGNGTGTNGAAGSAATANTGSGGGGGGGGSGSGGNGGSGVVILSVPTANYSGITTGSPTITTSGSNTIIKFTSGSGTYTG